MHVFTVVIHAFIFIVVTFVTTKKSPFKSLYHAHWDNAPTEGKYCNSEAFLLFFLCSLLLPQRLTTATITVAPWAKDTLTQNTRKSMALLALHIKMDSTALEHRC